MKRLMWIAGLMVVVAASMASGAVIHAQVIGTPAQTRLNLEECAKVVERYAPEAPEPHSSPRASQPTLPTRVLMSVNSTRFVDAITRYDFDLSSGFSPYAYVAEGEVKAKGVFVQVHATFANVTDSELIIANNDDFTLLDERGAEYRVATSATVTPRQVRYREAPVADVVMRPGEAYNALLHFDIPRTGYQRNLKLRFRDDPPVSFRAIPSPR